MKREKVAVANALQLEGRTMPAQVVLGCFWPNLYCACTQTAITEHPIKILTSPVDSSTQTSYKRAIIWRLDDIFAVTLTFETWPWTFVVHHVYVFKLYNKFERDRTIRGSVIDDLTNIFASFFNGWWQCCSLQQSHKIWELGIDLHQIGMELGRSYRFSDFETTGYEARSSSLKEEVYRPIRFPIGSSVFKGDWYGK